MYTTLKKLEFLIISYKNLIKLKQFQESFC